jgi:vancomycin permeability regulator SanA
VELKGDVDCAVVLGAGLRDDGSPSDVLRDRLDESLALYRAHRVTKIIVSGDHRTAAYDEPNAMRVYLEANGVPAEAVFMDHAGLDTYSSMWRARHVFGATRVIVVTQEFHLARAVWCARALGMQAEGSAADRHAYRGIAWLQVREVGSRTKAFLDVTVGRTPHHEGPPIDLGGDGRVTAG